MKKDIIYILLMTLSVGGAERHASYIANHLSDLGYDVRIILIADGCVDYQLRDNIKVVDLQNESYPENVLKLSFFQKAKLKFLRRFSKKRFDWYDQKLYVVNHFAKKVEYYLSKQDRIENSLIISFLSQPNISACYSKKKCGYKVIMAEFSSPQDEFEKNAPENKLKERYFKLCDGFIFQTEGQREFYSYLKNINTRIIPNPIEIISVEATGVRSKEIVNFCRLSTAKNIPLLIDAFSRLHKEYPDYKVVIYGEGPEKQNIQNRIKENRLEDNVELRPFAPNVLALICDCAMFVSSSDREGISNSMIEAMAIGLPTICTDCPAGGARMMIRPYENGILTPVGDEEALYKAMKYMIENPDKAERMGKQAMEVREVLRKDKILNMWVQFIEEVLEK